MNSFVLHEKAHIELQMRVFQTEQTIYRKLLMKQLSSEILQVRRWAKALLQMNETNTIQGTFPIVSAPHLSLSLADSETRSFT